MYIHPDSPHYTYGQEEALYTIYLSNIQLNHTITIDTPQFTRAASSTLYRPSGPPNGPSCSPAGRHKILHNRPVFTLIPDHIRSEMGLQSYVHKCLKAPVTQALRSHTAHLSVTVPGRDKYLVPEIFPLELVFKGYLINL